MLIFILLLYIRNYIKMKNTFGLEEVQEIASSEVNGVEVKGFVEKFRAQIGAILLASTLAVGGVGVGSTEVKAEGFSFGVTTANYLEKTEGLSLSARELKFFGQMLEIAPLLLELQKLDGEDDTLSQDKVDIISKLEGNLKFVKPFFDGKLGAEALGAWRDFATEGELPNSAILMASRTTAYGVIGDIQSGEIAALDADTRQRETNIAALHVDVADLHVDVAALRVEGAVLDANIAVLDASIADLKTMEIALGINN